jgi:hypothetical protein
MNTLPKPPAGRRFPAGVGILLLASAGASLAMAGDLDPSYSEFYGGKNGTSKKGITWTKAIAVSVPAPCSEIKGDVTVTFKAPGMMSVLAYSWQPPTKANPAPLGHDANVAPGLVLDKDGNGSFIFHADQFPNGPITLRLYGKGEGQKKDYCELQLFNQGGVVWNQGVPKTDPPAARGMKMAFADDFDGPLSIAADNSARYWTHWGGGDGSSWGFGENEGPRNPFSRVGTWLRIHASKPAGGQGVTGSLSSVHRDRTGIMVTAPCYLECRFLAQNAPGTWPAFWVTTQTSDPKAGCDEMDVIEAYGTNDGSGLWSGYRIATHFWGRPEPAFPHAALVETTDLGGLSSWSTTFHTYGLLVTESDTVYYFDDLEVLRHPTGSLAKVLPMGFLVNLALGSGWPIDLERYGNQSDMWVDYVRLYQGAKK